MESRELLQTIAKSARQKLMLACFITGVLFLFFSLNQNLKQSVFHHNSEIWADKAGYYVYLPATFIYHWNGKTMPNGIDSLTGNGFRIDQKSGGIYTKYPPGVAVLASPFFLVAHSIQSATDKKNANGFTKIYHIFQIIAALFYYIFGFYLLGLIGLLRGRKLKEVLFFLLLILFGSNIAYYMVWQPAMSHGYALFAMSLLLYLLHKKPSIKNTILLAIVIGLVGSIRSVNLIFILPILFLFRKEILNYFQNIKATVLFFTGILIGILPYIMQWFYLHNSGKQPYAGEHFTHLSNPWFAAIYFSATNGIAVYTPLLFLMILFVFVGIFYATNRKYAIAISAVLLLVTFLYGSWWIPTMGCGFGHRSFIDIIPFIYFYLILHFRQGILFHPLFIAFAFVCIVYSSYLANAYPGCLNDGMGQKVWNWAEYESLWK